MSENFLTVSGSHFGSHTLRLGGRVQDGVCSMAVLDKVHSILLTIYCFLAPESIKRKRTSG